MAEFTFKAQRQIYARCALEMLEMHSKIELSFAAFLPLLTNSIASMINRNICIGICIP